MTQPILHPKTKTDLERYLERPTHGLLLTGQSGFGKYFLALWLARSLTSSSYVIEKPDDKSTISIDQIRELYNVTRSGTPLTIVIKDSHNLGTEAQNAFLKLLEEPPKNTRFILTTDQPSALLQTIHSRTQTIEVIKPDATELTRHAFGHSSLNPTEIESLLLTTEAKTGDFITLLADDDRLKQHLELVQNAKSFYSADPYSRHVHCQENKYDKEWAKDLLQILAIIISSLIKRPPINNSALARLTKQVELIEEVSYRLFQINGNPKIHLAKLSQYL